MNIGSCFYQCYCLSSHLPIRYYYIFPQKWKSVLVTTYSNQVTTTITSNFYYIDLAAGLKEKLSLIFIVSS